MFLNDPLEHRRIAVAVPDAFGIHHSNRSAFANAQAVCLGAKDASLFRQVQFLQSTLEKVPGGDTSLLLTTLRCRLIGADEDMALGHWHTDRGGDLFLGISHSLRLAINRLNDK